MTRTVQCVHLKREAEGLDFAPLPGELGVRVYNEVSRQAWQEWLAYQTRLINENLITPMDPKARKFLAGQMQKFLFDIDVEMPPGFVEPEQHL